MFFSSSHRKTVAENFEGFRSPLRAIPNPFRLLCLHRFNSNSLFRRASFTKVPDQTHMSHFFETRVSLLTAFNFHNDRSGDIRFTNFAS